MRDIRGIEEKERHIHSLVEEVQRGEHKKDILINSAYGFEFDVQADYFSNARRNMTSDTAMIIMHTNQQLVDLKVLKGLKNYE